MGRYSKDIVGLWKDLYKKQLSNLVFGIISGIIFGILATGFLIYILIIEDISDNLVGKTILTTLLGASIVLSAIGVCRQVNKIRFLKRRLKVVDRLLNE